MCRYSLTQIAVDWGVHAADGIYYDVLFIGTGRRLTLSDLIEYIQFFLWTVAPRR